MDPYTTTVRILGAAMLSALALAGCESAPDRPAAPSPVPAAPRGA